MVNNYKYFTLLAFLFFSFAATAQIRFATPQKSGGQLVEPAEVTNFTQSLFSADDLGLQIFSTVGIDDKKTEVLQNEDTIGMLTLGMMYLQGANVEQDFKQAKEWLLAASKLGNSDAMIQLALLYSLNENITKITPREDLAKKWIEEAVRKKNPKAYLEIGRMMETGSVYEVNVDKALKFYQLAAQASNTNAYAKLASMYLYGRGVPKDMRKAVNYLRRLKAETSNPEIKNQVDRYLSDIYFKLAFEIKNKKTKFSLYELAWDHGNKKAGDAIADMYYEGAGVKKNYLKALEWYELSVKKFESVYAMEKLGFLYLKAPGDVPRDYNKAKEYFENAARLGGVKGAHMIGYMYEYGIGVAKNDSEANKWYSRAQVLEGRSTDKSNKAEFIEKAVY